MAIPFLNNINLDDNQLLNAKIHVTSSAPTAGKGQIYLDSTANGYSATGIGCFLDDIIHQLMGFKSKKFQVLYNFTVGSAILDSRLQTISPYKN